VITRADLVAGPAHLLVELDFGGGLVLSTVDLEIETEDGTTQVVHGCLEEVAWSDQLDTPGSVGEGDGIPVNGVLPVDVALLVARGARLELTAARVSRWVEGKLWHERELLYRGLVTDPEYGEVEDEVSFSIEKEEVQEVSPCIPLRAAVTSATWDTSSSNLDEVDIGRAYPTIIGRPGAAPWSDSGRVSATAGVWARKQNYWHKLIVAGHPVKATTVWINSDATTTAAEVPVTHEVDGLGRTVAVIDFHATDDPGIGGLSYEDVDGNALDVVQVDDPDPADDYPVYVAWPDAGGLIGGDGAEIRGAGDVLTWALSQCDGPVDLARCRAVAPLLNHILIDGAIEESNATMWDWLTRQLLPLLPVSIVDGPDGRYPVVWKYDATVRDVVRVLDLDLELDVEFGRIRTDSSQVRNEWSIEYGLSRRVGRYQRTHLVGHFVAERATCVLDGPSGESVFVEMEAYGLGGSGVTITVTETGAASVTEDPVAKTIDLTFDDGVTTSVVIANLLLTCSQVRRAHVRGDAGGLWGSFVGGNEQTQVTALHRSNGAAGSLACDVSQRRYARPGDPDGRRVISEAMTTDYLYDDASAASVIRWKVAAFAFAARRLDVNLPEGDWGDLRRGQVVRIRSSTLYLDDLALVEHPELHGDGMVSYTFRLLDDPLRTRVLA
jgi:hypothetical protein